MPSVSKSQQRLMGQAYAFKKGDLSLSNLSPKYANKIKNLADSMSKKQLKDYASTKHKNIPKKKRKKSKNESKILSYKNFIK